MAARAAAFEAWRSIRTSSVRRPFRVSHAANGSGAAPKNFRIGRISSFTRSVAPVTIPPSATPCPAMNFVVLWTTRSAPQASGRWSAGVANVPSTASRAPASLAAAAAAAMSVTWRRGLAGVSTYSRAGGPPVAAAERSASESPAGTKSTSIP